MPGAPGGRGIRVGTHTANESAVSPIAAAAEAVIFLH